MEVVFRIVLVVLAIVAISFPLIDFPNIPNFYGTTALNSHVLGNAAYLIPAAFAYSSVLYLVKTPFPLRRNNPSNDHA